MSFDEILPYVIGLTILLLAVANIQLIIYNRKIDRAEKGALDGFTEGSVVTDIALRLIMIVGAVVYVVAFI